MENIIEPVAKEHIISELTPDKLLRKTNKAGNDIYIVTSQDAPYTMQEIGRLREITYREAGGSSGQSCDIDQFDTMDNPYKQLIVWDPDAQEIIGGYRYMFGREILFDDRGQPRITSSHLFKYSPEFIAQYLPYTIELGRAFVAPEYQSSKAGAKGLFALDNLWDGLGALSVIGPNVKYFLGKVTIYKNYNEICRNNILAFLDKYFMDSNHLVTPYSPICLQEVKKIRDNLFTENDFKADYKILNSSVRELGYNIPPMISAYINLSPSMMIFGSCINDELEDAIETGILVTVADIFPEKYTRHIGSYLSTILHQQEV